MRDHLAVVVGMVIVVRSNINHVCHNNSSGAIVVVVAGAGSTGSDSGGLVVVDVNLVVVDSRKTDYHF